MPSPPRPKTRTALARRRRAAIIWSTRESRARRFALHHLFETHLAAGTLCLVPFDKYEIFVDPRDDKIAYTVLSGNEWQRRQFDNAMTALDHLAIPDQLPPAHHGVFIDVGANIGTVTLHALLSGRFEHVVAIEPDAANRGILERNLRHNGVRDRATVVAAAASRSTGTMTLYQDAKNYGAHSLERGFSKSQTAGGAVPVDTLDNLIAEVGVRAKDVGVIKIDVEGHEHAVLEGMGKLLNETKPVMLEATFRAPPPSQPAAAGQEGASNIFDLFPADYESCYVLDGKTPEQTSLRSFQPTAPQHDLLITRGPANEHGR